MSQISFSDTEHAGKRKKTRREVFLGEMELVVPWKALLKVIEPHYPVADRGRRPYPLETMLRVHLMQNWFALSDPAMEEALYEIASLRAFAGLGMESVPDETTILNFRHLLEASDLAEDIFKQVNAHLARKGLLLKRGSILDATIIAAPSFTKNSTGERDPDGPNYFAPTVLSGATLAMKLASEETFGPVAAIFRFTTEEEVLAAANGTPYGLAAYFYSSDLKRVSRVSAALECGIMGVNEGLVSSETAPFGGIKESGYGREGSRHGLADYTDLKYICTGGLA